MPHGKTKFQEIWLEKELDGVLVNQWCISADDVYVAKCKLCVEKFDISGSGFAQVKSHHKGKKHTLKFNSRFKNKSTISNAFQQKNATTDERNALSHEMQIVKAETLWALRVVESNMSFKSCTETTETFKDMFPDSIIASQMELKEKKVAYVISHGLCKNFQEQLIHDIASSSTDFTIAFDETTNSQVKRQLDVYIRYWSEHFNIVSCRYLTSVFLGHATADILLKNLLDVLSFFKISLGRIICLSMDNPNVNKSLLRKFNEKVKDDCGRETVPLGSCNLHVANNAFKHLLNALDLKFEEFATDVHFFLKYSAARREDYQCVEEVTQETAKFFLRHVGSRWLTAGPVAQRLLDQWGNMCEYFLKFLPSQKSQEKHVHSERYRRIRENLKNSTMPSFLSFITFTHRYFEIFSLNFQNEAPKIHVLYEELNKLIRSVMMQVLKEDVVAKKEGNDLQKINEDDKENWKKLNEIEIGMRAKNLLANVNENDKKRFLMNIRRAVISTTSYLKSRLPFCNQILKDMEILRPLDVVSTSTPSGLYSVTRIAKFLRFTENDIDSIREEWKLLRRDDKAHEVFSNSTSPNTRIDVYWSNLSSLVDMRNQAKYPNLLKLIKTSLVLPHGNADPERGFSINKSMLKGSYNENTIQSLRSVKDTIRNYGGVRNIPITMSLLNNVKHSYKSYQQYLEKQKEEKEMEKREMEKKEKENCKKQENLKRKHDSDMKINEIDAEISQIKSEKNIALELIAEGSERLAKSVAEKNNIEMSVASALVLQATEELKKLESKLSDYEMEKTRLLGKINKIKF